MFLAQLAQWRLSEGRNVFREPIGNAVAIRALPDLCGVETEYCAVRPGVGSSLLGYNSLRHDALTLQLRARCAKPRPGPLDRAGRGANPEFLSARLLSDE